MTEFTKQQIDEDLRIRAEESKRANEYIELLRQSVKQQRLTCEAFLKSIDWESRRWQAAVAAMQAARIAYREESSKSIASLIMADADALIAEYQKEKPDAR